MVAPARGMMGAAAGWALAAVSPLLAWRCPSRVVPVKRERVTA